MHEAHRETYVSFLMKKSGNYMSTAKFLIKINALFMDENEKI